MSNAKSRQARIPQSRKIATGFKAGFIVMTAIATLAIIQWQRAEQASNIALAGQLVAQVQSTILSEHASPETALLLAIQSMRLTPSGEAAQILRRWRASYRRVGYPVLVRKDGRSPFGDSARTRTVRCARQDSPRNERKDDE